MKMNSAFKVYEIRQLEYEYERSVRNVISYAISLTARHAFNRFTGRLVP